MKGADGVPRGVILLHKGNRLEQPLQAVCPLEIRSTIEETIEKKGKNEEPSKPVHARRKAAVDAHTKIQVLGEDNAI